MAASRNDPPGNLPSEGGVYIHNRVITSFLTDFDDDMEGATADPETPRTTFLELCDSTLPTTRELHFRSSLTTQASSNFSTTSPLTRCYKQPYVDKPLQEIDAAPVAMPKHKKSFPSHPRVQHKSYKQPHLPAPAPQNATTMTAQSIAKPEKKEPKSPPAQQLDASDSPLMKGWGAWSAVPEPQIEEAWKPAPLHETLSPLPEYRPQTSDRSPDFGRGGYRGRGRGRGRGQSLRPTLKRDERWPKSSEMATDPKAYKANWDSTSPKKSSTIGSCWADGGDLTTTKRRLAAQGKGIELSGWDGNWAPPPIDWDNRPGFRESQSTLLIAEWMDQVEVQMKDVQQKVCLKMREPAEAEEQRTIQEEIAPRYWVPISLDEQSPGDFWHEVITSNHPSPVDYGDLWSVKPWWLTYTSMEEACQTIESYQHHWQDAGVDPDENSMEKRAREADEGSGTAAARRKDFEQAKLDAKRQKAARREKKLEARKDSGLSSGIPEGPKSDLNMYIRSAKESDMEDVRKIYNHYVEFTTSTSELENLTLDKWNTRYSNTKTGKLPFLVAFERGKKLQVRKKRLREEEIILPDTLVGFAYAKDYGTTDVPTIYNSTVEIQVCTNDNFIRKGVARCLVDQLLGQIDLSYFPGRGFEFDPEEIQETGPLSTRKVRNIVVQVPYVKPERLEWVGRWLTTRFGFSEAGMLADIGMKHKTRIHLATFQRPCNTTVKSEGSQ